MAVALGAAVFAAACSNDPGGAVTERIDIAIIGDSFTEGTPLGGEGESNWTRVLSTRLDGAGVVHSLRAEASSGSGYSSPGVRNLTFAQLAELAITPETDLVIVFGSVNDAGTPEGRFSTDVRTTLEAIRKRAGSATLLVVGPAWVDARIPPEIVRIEEVLRMEALRVDAEFVNPLKERWFFDPNRSSAVGLISTDGLHPTDDGHEYLAERMAEKVRLEIRNQMADTVP